MPKIASSATTRRSAHSANPIPPPTANPSTAAITGFVSRSRLGPIGAIESWPPISRFLLGSPDATAFRSAPAQKYPPVPVNTATDVRSSASKATNASNSFRAVAPSTALRQCGRLMETMVIGPSCLTRMVSASLMARSRLASDRKVSAGDQLVRLEVTLARRVHHARRQWRRWSVAVPAAGAPFRIEIIAQRLLVEARLRPAGRVDIRRPEPRAVGGHHLVDQDDAAVGVAAEFEFGVGDKDALAAADGLAERIDRAGHALQRVGHLIAEDFAHPADGDVLVMASLGLGGRTEDRRLQFCAFKQPRRQLLAGQRAL